MLAQLTEIKVRLGFWHGMGGVVIDKMPLLPLYRVDIQKIGGVAVLIGGDSTCWLWRFQFRANPPKLVKLDHGQMIEQAVKFLNQHSPETLHPENIIVQRVMHPEEKSAA